jgi:hypothetical protein
VAEEIPDDLVPPLVVPPELVRVSDIDRKKVADRLHLAHAEGLITLAEFDLRVGAAWQARNRGELARLTYDLPEPQLPMPVAGRPAVLQPRRVPTALRVLATIWLSVTVVNLVVWGLVCVTSGEFVYPWWVWVGTPSGAVLGTLWLMLGNRDEPGNGPDKK